MNKQEFFKGIDWEAPLNHDIIKKEYGYSLYDSQFLADVMAEYEKHGRSGVKYIYQLYVNLEEWNRERELKPIARDLTRRIDADYERMVKENDRRETRFKSWHGFKGFPSIL